MSRLGTSMKREYVSKLLRERLSIEAMSKRESNIYQSNNKCGYRKVTEDQYFAVSQNAYSIGKYSAHVVDFRAGDYNSLEVFDIEIFQYIRVVSVVFVYLDSIKTQIFLEAWIDPLFLDSHLQL